MIAIRSVILQKLIPEKNIFRIRYNLGPGSQSISCIAFQDSGAFPYFSKDRKAEFSNFGVGGGRPESAVVFVFCRLDAHPAFMRSTAELGKTCPPHVRPVLWYRKDMAQAEHWPPWPPLFGRAVAHGFIWHIICRSFCPSTVRTMATRSPKWTPKWTWKEGSLKMME